MKKFTITSLAIAMLLSIGGYCKFSKVDLADKLSEIQLANIEALSQIEIPGKEARDEYCEPMSDCVCTIYWQANGNEEINSTSFFGYFPK